MIMQIPIPDKYELKYGKIVFAVFMLVFPFMLSAQDEAAP